MYPNKADWKTLSFDTPYIIHIHIRFLITGILKKAGFISSDVIIKDYTNRTVIITLIRPLKSANLLKLKLGIYVLRLLLMVKYNRMFNIVIYKAPSWLTHASILGNLFKYTFKRRSNIVNKSIARNDIKPKYSKNNR